MAALANDPMLWHTEVWLFVAACFIVVLFPLALSTVGSAVSYVKRKRQKQFPLIRCLLAAAGPSLATTVGLLVVIVLGWPGVSESLTPLALMLSMWASYYLEPRLPERSSSHDHGQEGRV